MPKLLNNTIAHRTSITSQLPMSLEYPKDKKEPYVPSKSIYIKLLKLLPERRNAVTKKNFTFSL